MVLQKSMKAEDISKKNRHRKYNLFLQMLKPTKSEKILDVGFANLSSG